MRKAEYEIRKKKQLIAMRLIKEEIIKKDKVIKNWLRKQLEDEANYENY